MPMGKLQEKVENYQHVAAGNSWTRGEQRKSLVNVKKSAEKKRAEKGTTQVKATKTRKKKTPLPVKGELSGVLNPQKANPALKAIMGGLA